MVCNQEPAPDYDEFFAGALRMLAYPAGDIRLLTFHSENQATKLQDRVDTFELFVLWS